MNMKHIIILLVALTCSFMQVKADDIPTIDPQATFITSEGEETGTSYQGSAPLTVRFAANAENVGHGARTTNGDSRRKETTRPTLSDMRRTRNIRSRWLALTT